MFEVEVCTSLAFSGLVWVFFFFFFFFPSLFDVCWLGRCSMGDCMIPGVCVGLLVFGTFGDGWRNIGVDCRTVDATRYMSSITA